MAEIEGPGASPIKPQNETYKQEYRQGTKLFQHALEECKSSNPYQQEQFKGVMKKAMTVLNETARGMKSENLMNQNKKIEHDLQDYLNKPTNETREHLSQDLKKANDSIESTTPS